jgi:hypothetical protein
MSMNTETKLPASFTTDLFPSLSKAFALVCPATRAAALASAYALDGYSAHWKDPIRAVVTDIELEATGVTIADVERAIMHYTSTTAKVTREIVKSTSFATYLAPVGAYTVFADGYRAGPAGDH